jgi:hypothetical protein
MKEARLLRFDTDILGYTISNLGLGGRSGKASEMGFS